MVVTAIGLWRISVSDLGLAVSSVSKTMSEPNRSQPHQQRVQTHFGGEPAYEDVERHPLVDAVRDGRRNDVAYILTGGTTPDVGNNRIGTPLVLGRRTRPSRNRPTAY